MTKSSGQLVFLSTITSADTPSEFIYKTILMQYYCVVSIAFHFSFPLKRPALEVANGQGPWDIGQLPCIQRLLKRHHKWGKIMRNVCEFKNMYHMYVCGICIYAYMHICMYIWFPVLSICLLRHFATFEPKLSNPQKWFQLPKLHLLFHLKVDFFTEIQTLKILPKNLP